MSLAVIRLLGVKITPGDLPGLHQEISRLIARKKPGIILSANVHSLNLCRQLPWLTAFYNQADIVYLDGAGVSLGAWLLGLGYFRRTTMHEWIWPAATYLAKRGHSLYLLGNPPGVAARAAANLKAHAPRLHLLGSHHGYFAKEGPENDAVMAAINRLAPDVLMVGLGMPLEQHWILGQPYQDKSPGLLGGGRSLRVLGGSHPRLSQVAGGLGFELALSLLPRTRPLSAPLSLGECLFSPSGSQGKISFIGMIWISLKNTLGGKKRKNHLV